MNTRIAAAGLMMGLLMAGPAIGAEVPTPPKSIVDIVKGLEAKGYLVVEIDSDDGGWEVEAYKGETPMELRVDPIQGNIISEHRDDAESKPPAGSLPLSAILQRLTAEGYTNIDEASFGWRTWEVEAYRGGTKRELRVDPKSGAVISDRVDD